MALAGIAALSRRRLAWCSNASRFGVALSAMRKRRCQGLVDPARIEQDAGGRFDHVVACAVACQRDQPGDSGFFGAGRQLGASQIERGFVVAGFGRDDGSQHRQRVGVAFEPEQQRAEVVSRVLAHRIRAGSSAGTRPRRRRRRPKTCRHCRFAASTVRAAGAAGAGADSERSGIRDRRRRHASVRA